MNGTDRRWESEGLKVSETTRDKHEPIRVGVIGVGRMGARHAQNLSGAVAGAKLVAVADPDEAAVRRVGDELGVAGVYTDYRELLARDDVEAVVIAAPADTREEMIAACLAAGKHMLCEKPVAHDLPAARRVAKMLEGAEVTFQLGFMRRFDPAYVRAHRLIREGVIGRPVFIRLVSRDAEGPPLGFVGGSGGLFVDSSVHDFDLARWLMGSEVERVYALGGTFVYPEYAEHGDIDVGAVSLRFAGGAIGLHDNARKSGYGYDIRTEVLGTDGAIQIGYLNQDSVVLLKKDRPSCDYVPDFLARFADAYRLELQHFIDVLRKGGTPAVGVEDGVRALEIAAAARASLESGLPVSVASQHPVGAADAEPKELEVS